MVVGAVSYTHLDVYKRQRFGDLEFALRLIMELGFEAVDLTMYDTFGGVAVRNRELFTGDIIANAKRCV